MTATNAPPAPTAGLLASVAVLHWIDRTPHGDAAFLLIAHPPARAGVGKRRVRAQMHALGDALGLAPAADQLPYIGNRLTLHGTRAALSVDQRDHQLGVDVEDKWNQFVIAGGPVVIALGLVPLAAGADRDSVEAYIGSCTLTGDLLFGITSHVKPEGSR